VRSPDLYASAFLVALAAVACVGAYQLGPGDVYNPGPGFMPMATAGVLGLMALVQLGRQLVAGPAGVVSAGAFASARWGTVVLVLGALAGFAMALDTAGFSVSTFLLLLVLLGPVARKRWWVALLSASVITVAVRVLFRALGVPLPEGPLGV
jgi:hypothetical protein